MGVAEGKIPSNSIAEAMLESYNVVNSVLETARSELPNMMKIKTAFELGQSAREAKLCNQVFECATKDIDIEIPDASRTVGQVDCGALGQVCPGVSFAVQL